MAIFRLEAKIIGRRAKTKAGKPIPGKSVSVVAKAAYRSGEKLIDERTDITYNYSSRGQEVVHREIVAPENAPGWLKPADGSAPGHAERQNLWNEVERAEKRVDSQLAREFVIALPVELDREQQASLLRHWCQQEVASKGFVADIAIHRSHDGNNPHSHVLCTLRPIDEDGFGKKPDMSGKFHAGGVGYGPKTELEGWRSSWEILCNEALERAGSDARIDHRSLTDQGIDREPEPKIGVEAIGMQRRGAEEDPDRVRDVRHIRMENDLLGEVRAVQKSGEVVMQGEDETTFLGRLRDGFSHLAAEWKTFLRDESSGGRPAPEEEHQRASDVNGAAHKAEVEPVWARRGQGSDVRPPDREVGLEPER
jgi:hypothetical protein